MASMPETPGRGRSRFSKVLPLPPPPPSASSRKPVSTVTSPALSSATATTTIQSSLPPIPPSKSALPPIVQAVPRRPLGMTAEQKALSAALARAVNSPLLHTSPAPAPSISRSISDISNATTMDSSSTTLGSPDTASSTPLSPPIPPKDNQRQTTKTPPPNEGFRLHNSSPPRPEIWRRRSNSATFNELKLSKSNGSTASAPQKELPQAPLPPLPRSITGSNPPPRKPVPVREASPPSESMGNQVTKLKEKASSSTRKPFHSSSTSQDASFSQQNEPLTPEYVAEEEAQRERQGSMAGLQRVISPRSPDTPPQEERPRIPPRSDSRSNPSLNQKAAPSRFVPKASNDSTSTIQGPHAMQSMGSSETLISPTPRLEHPRKDSGILTPPDMDDLLAETASKDLPAPPEQTRSPPARSSIHFPTLNLPPVPEDTVLPGLPLNITHFECYQSHKFMRGSRNLTCPVACMVCSKQDRETRWRCTWCCLSACATCMQVLTQVPGKNLKVAMEKMQGIEVPA